jgi:hypothetical protein
MNLRVGRPGLSYVSTEHALRIVGQCSPTVTQIGVCEPSLAGELHARRPFWRA